MFLLRLIARSLFATIFVRGGYGAFQEPAGRAKMVEQALPLPEPELMVRINAAAMMAGGAALALGVKPRLAALGLAASLVPTTYAGHQFWTHDDPASRRGQRLHFEKNVSLIGGLLTYALTRDG